MKIIILGHARMGKDTTAEIIAKHFGLKFKSSSQAACDIFLYEALRDKYHYKTPEECFEDRVNHRAEWHDLICDYNKDNPARLAEKILTNNDMYVGMRSDIELEACKSIVDWVIGVYDDRKLEEDESSFNIDMWSKCDFVIPNGGTLEQLEEKIIKIFNKIICD